MGPGSGDVAPSYWYGGRGVFAGGWKGSNEDTIEYITIATTGNSADFGNLSEAKNGTVATSGN